MALLGLCSQRRIGACMGKGAPTRSEECMDMKNTGQETKENTSNPRTWRESPGGRLGLFWVWHLLLFCLVLSRFTKASPASSSGSADPSVGSPGECTAGPCGLDTHRDGLQQPGGATPVCVYTRDEVMGEAALRDTTLQSLGLTGGSASIRFVMKRCDPVGKTPASLGSSASAGQAAASPPLPLESGELCRGDLSRQEDVDTMGSSCEDLQKKQSMRAPMPAPFVPFSGGGQRLGGPSGPMRPLISSSAKLPTSLSSPGGPSKPKKSKPGQDPQQEPEPEPPVDREPVVCHPDLEERLQAWSAELPDEFFELTVDDLRRRLAQLKSERKRLEEAPLMTKAFREAQMKEKLERYPKVALRVLFPDRYILQGFFRPSETVGDLRDFVRSHLGHPELPFYLCTFCPQSSPLQKQSWTTTRAPSFRRTSSRLLWCTLEPRNQQVSTWSLACWSAPSPHPRPTCWWPGTCPEPPGPLPHCQPLTLHLSLSHLLRRGRWAPLSPSQRWFRL
ncbi:tether containing UBX domain for GLUT4 isoform X11 [Callithrix jacchus]